MKSSWERVKKEIKKMKYDGRFYQMEKIKKSHKLNDQELIFQEAVSVTRYVYSNEPKALEAISYLIAEMGAMSKKIEHNKLLASDIKKNISEILGEALSGNKKTYEAADGVIRWALVLKDMHNLVDDKLLSAEAGLKTKKEV